MLKTAPDPVDVQDLQFILKCRLKIFDNKDSAPFSKQCNLVACASRFGLIFIGTTSTNFQVIQLKSLEEYSKSDGDKADYPKRIIPLASPPKYLSVNCEHTILAVVTEKDSCPVVTFYDVKSFWQQNVTQIEEIRLSPTPGVAIVDVGWNPSLGAIFTACKSDGTLGVYELKNPGIECNELPSASGATCFCWSPKGKQLAVGSRDGKITQYKPDLKAVKVINAPQLTEPHSLISLQWISNYQFIGIFQSINLDNPACLIVVDAPKTGEPRYTNYDDICYSNGSTRPPQFYMILQQSWNILLVVSSNSMEVGVLGNSGENWTQWTMGDAARAELPLGSDHQETLPIGIGLDIGNTQSVVWGESTLSPPPILLLLSHYGILCCFNVINLKEGIPTICTPPDPIGDTSGLQFFTTPPIPAITETPQKHQIQTKPLKTVTFAGITSAASTLGQQTRSQESQPINLFGGQVTLTPVLKNSTPIGSQVTVIPVSKNSAPPSQSLYPTLPHQPQSIYPQLPTEMKTPTTVPQRANITLIQQSEKAVTSQPSLVQSMVKLNQDRSTENVNKKETVNSFLEVDKETEAISAKMVREECFYLESLSKEVLNKGKTLKINLGTDEDKMNIVTLTAALEEFSKEVLDICTTQNAEVHVLKQNLLQSWAWYEDAKSRHAASNNESISIILKAQPLDSASEKQLEDIRYANYYLESQIAQAHRALDEQWESFQDYCKKTHKIQIPTMEMIFQTMVKQNAIIQKQSYILKDIANRIKSKSRTALGPSLLRSVESIKELGDEVRRLRLDPEDVTQLQYERVVNRTKKLTKEKTDTLRTFLKNREYPHVSTMKSQVSSILQNSPSGRLKQLSLLSAKMSPISKEFAPQKLDFIQSTPKPIISKFESSGMPSNTPIEGLQNFTAKFETINFQKPGEKTFAPLSKGLASSPNSAFVSTSYPVVSPVAAPVSSKPLAFGTVVSTTPQSFLKTTPAFVLATNVTTATGQPIITISTKPFPKTAPQQISITNTSVSKPQFSFNLQPVVTSAIKPSTTVASNVAVSSPKTTGSIFGTSTSSISAIPLIKSVTANESNKTNTIPSIFGSSSSNTGTFSFGPNSGIIFNASTQKSAESPSVMTTKPFSFTSVTSKTTTPVTGSVPTSTSAQNIASFTSTTQVTSSVSATISTTALSKTAVATTSSQSSIFGAAQASTSKPSLFGTFAPSSTTTSFIFGSTNSASVSKPTLFVSTNTQPTTPAVTTVIPTAVIASSSVLGAGTNSSQSTSASSSQTSLFGSSTSISKPSIFSGTTAVSKPSIFENAPTASTTTTQSSIFGTPLSPATTKPSIFGNVTTSQPSILQKAVTTSSTQPSLFVPAATTAVTTSSTQPSFVPASDTAVTTQPSLFGAVTSTSTTTTQPSIFESVTATSTIQPSIFGTSTPSTSQALTFGSVTTASAPSPRSAFGNSTATPNTSSIFGSTTTSSNTTSVFGAATTSSGTTSIFGTPTTPSSKTSIFGTITTPSNTTSIFGAAGTPSSTTSIFGSAAPTSQPTVFGAAVPSTSQPSVFGTPTTSVQSVFGATSLATTQPSIFGSPATSAAVKPSIFGPPVTSATSQSSVFGGFRTTSQKPSIFGAPASSTQSSIFGGATPSSSAQSVFGSSSQSPAFGTAVTAPQFGNTTFGTAATSTASPFGQTSIFNAPKSTSASVFGQNSAFSSSGSTFGGGSVFGSSTQPVFGQSSSVFGSTSTTPSNVFGTPTTSNTFGSGSVFGTPVSSTSSPFGGGSVFGSTAPQSSGSFGFGTLNVGDTQTTSSFGFGQTSTANPFATPQKSVFGGENKSIFGSPATTSSSSAFGSGSVFGNTSQTFGSSTFGSRPAFAQQSTFGQSSFGSNTFGQQSGPFSAGSSGSVAQSGFGGSPTFQKPAGFGGAPAFGSPPTFGGNPSFGGAPTFGSSPTFGSTSKAFGSGTPAFGNAGTVQNAAFANLANQPTIGFGNLAQQAANSPTSGTSFSGTSSFSSWR